jgi:hypothetical protein
MDCLKSVRRIVRRAAMGGMLFLRHHEGNLTQSGASSQRDERSDRINRINKI